MAHPGTTQGALGASGALPQAAPRPTAERTPTSRDYVSVFTALGAYGCLLFVLVSKGAGAATRPEALLAPVLALAALVAVVWVAMAVLRNFAILSKRSSGLYYYAYDHDPPPDWIERPARTFNNLMQVPTLFYVLCVLILITRRVDAAQLSLAWAFVALRAMHSAIYILWNHLPARFGSYVAGVITLAVLWFRFASQAWDLIAGS